MRGVGVNEHLRNAAEAPHDGRAAEAGPQLVQ